MYVIVNHSVPGRLEYWGVDRSSGGYPYWDSSITGAVIFETIGAAKTALESSDFCRSIVMSNKSVYPPRMVSMALRLSCEKLKGFGQVTIERVELSTVETYSIAGEIPA